MINAELRDFLAEINPEMIILDNPSFDNSIIGTDFAGRIVYSYDKMIEEWIKRADNNLYYGKNHGKNQVVFTAG